jgi:uncharacterized protein (DUF488 family)
MRSAEPPPAERVLITVGHSTLAASEFLALLTRAGIAEIADVRRFPGSRRHPQFNSDALAETLASAGIGYRSFAAELGGRRQPVAESVNDGWRVRQFQGYADHMASSAFASGIAALAVRARDRRVAVMCAEAVWWRCHRRLIADAALLRGFDVRHLLTDGTFGSHRLTEFAVRRGIELTYPAQPTLESAGR